MSFEALGPASDGNELTSGGAHPRRSSPGEGMWSSYLFTLASKESQPEGGPRGCRTSRIKGALGAGMMSGLEGVDTAGDVTPARGSSTARMYLA